MNAEREPVIVPKSDTREYRMPPSGEPNPFIPPRLKIEQRSGDARISNSDSERNMTMRTSSHPYAVLELLASSADMVVNRLDVAALLKERGTDQGAHSIVAQINTRLRYLSPTGDVIVNEFMGYTPDGVPHNGYRFRADVEFVEE